MCVWGGGGGGVQDQDSLLVKRRNDNHSLIWVGGGGMLMYRILMLLESCHLCYGSSWALVFRQYCFRRTCIPRSMPSPRSPHREFLLTNKFQIKTYSTVTIIVLKTFCNNSMFLHVTVGHTSCLL